MNMTIATASPPPAGLGFYVNIPDNPDPRMTISRRFVRWLFQNGTAQRQAKALNFSARSSVTSSIIISLSVSALCDLS
jgi:hypothetical protein